MSEIEKPLNGRRLRAGHPEYDAKKQAELDKRVQRIEANRRKGDVARFLEGWDLQYIRDTKLYRQDGFGDFKVWVGIKLGLTPSKAHRRIELAERFPKHVVEKHGVEKLAAAMEYANRTLDEDDEQHDVTRLVFDVPTEERKIVGVPFSEATMPQIEAALTHQRSLARRRAHAALPERERRVLDDLGAALTPPDREEPLAALKTRAAKSGLVEDTVVQLDVRFGDLEAVLERLARLYADHRKARGR